MKKYLYFPSFGRGRRNNYAGALAGYIYAVLQNDATLDASVRVSPTRLANKYHTNPEIIRTALRCLCTDSLRFRALLERTGHSRYRLTPLGIQFYLNDKPQLFNVADLYLPGFTPKLAAVQNTKAKYPAAAAKWWGVTIKQWYKLLKQVEYLQKPDTGASPNWIQGRVQIGYRSYRKWIQGRPRPSISVLLMMSNHTVLHARAQKGRCWHLKKLNAVLTVFAKTVLINST